MSQHPDTATELPDANVGDTESSTEDTIKRLRGLVHERDSLSLEKEKLKAENKALTERSQELDSEKEELIKERDQLKAELASMKAEVYIISNPVLHRLAREFYRLAHAAEIRQEVEENFEFLRHAIETDAPRVRAIKADRPIAAEFLTLDSINRICDAIDVDRLTEALAGEPPGSPLARLLSDALELEEEEYQNDNGAECICTAALKMLLSDEKPEEVKKWMEEVAAKPEQYHQSSKEQLERLKLPV